MIMSACGAGRRGVGGIYVCARRLRASPCRMIFFAPGSDHRNAEAAGGGLHAARWLQCRAAVGCTLQCRVAAAIALSRGRCRRREEGVVRAQARTEVEAPFAVSLRPSSHCYHPSTALRRSVSGAPIRKNEGLPVGQAAR